MLNSPKPRLLRHPEWSTVAMEIIHRKDVFRPDGQDVAVLEVSWWNIGRCHKPFPIMVFTDMTIPRTKLDEFVEFGSKEMLSDEEFERLCVGYNPLIK